MKIGVLKEGKIPTDKRVPLTPQQCREVMDKFPEVEVVVQKSDIRSYTDQEYADLGIQVVDEVTDCDVLMGVKEVPKSKLIPKKTYFYFSHTIKKQPYNRELLQLMLQKKIRMIDYETLTDESGQRVVAFGWYAGYVGAYNGILTYGLRTKKFNLKPAHTCFDIDEVEKEFTKVDLGNSKIILTGGGRVATGSMEVLDKMGVKKVSPKDFLEKEFTHAVYTQLRSEDFNKAKDGSAFDKQLFYSNPEKFESDFFKYATKANILIAGAYWNPKAPVLFTKEDCLKPEFSLEVIADITCDIQGSIPSTLEPSTIDNPIYDYNPTENAVNPAFSNPKNISVMAVDNLPCELPRNASNDFGRQLIDNVLESLIREDKTGIIERALMSDNGKLTPRYAYLQDYVNGIE